MAAKMMRKEAAVVQGNVTEAKPEDAAAAAAAAVKSNQGRWICGLCAEAKIREKNQGRWICGLCAEAVKVRLPFFSAPVLSSTT
ncbi:hypothetical protein DM860_006603 [Cuscuta australis]|uniref:Uncharacterized protein n=1 Tax=Cuscuta australis TaxID=267555 RepID=A0A328D954_9ASTE|nr:hypothetical protein DM860_006603 [Cuscuta australis]